MDWPELESVVKNLDHGLVRVEQILPSLASKEDLLATRVDLRAALKEEGERTRCHFDVVAESLRGDIGLLAEGQVTLQERIDGLRMELKADIANLDRRVMRLDADRHRR